MRNIKIFVAICAIGLLGFASVPALAADFLYTDRSGNVTSSDQHEDLYAAGGTVNINGNTSGDLVVAGGSINVTGSVEDDILFAGGNVNISGTVGDDMRGSGGNVQINAAVTGDVFVAGGTITTSDNASIGNGLYVAGGTVNINGPVSGPVNISGGTVTINSEIGGDVVVRAGNLVFGSEAVVTGQVRYSGGSPAEVESGAQVSNIQFTQVERDVYGFSWLSIFFVALAYLVTTFLLFAIFPERTIGVAEGAIRRPWLFLLIGLIYMIVMPVLIILLMFTVIGWIVAIILILAHLLILLISWLLMPVFLGTLLLGWLRRRRREGESEVTWYGILLGAVVLWALAFIPVVGWLAIFITYLITLGGVIMYSRRIRPSWMEK